MSREQKQTIETRVWRSFYLVALSLIGFFLVKIYHRIDISYDAAISQVPVNAAFAEYHKMHFTWQGKVDLKLADMQKDYYMLLSKQNP